MKTHPDQSASTPDLRRRAEAQLKGPRAADGGQRSADEVARLVLELEVHQIELELQNEELRTSRAAVETGLAHYADLYDFAPTGYLTLDRAGTIRQVNLTGAQLLGVARSQLVQRRFGLFVVESDRPAFNDFLAKVFASENSERCEVTLARAGLPPVVVRIEATRSADGQECRAVALDITARRESDAVLTFLARYSDAKPGEGFFAALARYLAMNLGMDFVCIDRLEGDGLTARTLAVWSDGKFEDNVSYALKDTPCGEVVGKQVCCFPASVCKFFPLDTVLKDLRAESYVGVSLFGHSGTPIGLIAVIGRRPLANRPQAEAILQLVAVRAAGELERQDAEAALAAQVDELRRWHQATLGREGRVGQLKKEVNALLTRLGEPPRYASVVEEQGAGGSEPVSQ
jgi:PAS domain-containing protein